MSRSIKEARERVKAAREAWSKDPWKPETELALTEAETDLHLRIAEAPAWAMLDYDGTSKSQEAVARSLGVSGAVAARYIRIGYELKRRAQEEMG